jgi:hypothetical protein
MPELAALETSIFTSSHGRRFIRRVGKPKVVVLGRTYGNA